MYKGTSRNLQRRHAVDKPLPTGGYIGVDTPDEIIPSADNMSREDCLAEQRQIKLEMAKIPNEIAVAKAGKDVRRAALLGIRQQSLQGRMTLIKKRLHALVQSEHHEAFYRATKEIVTSEQLAAIIARQRTIQEEATHPASATAPGSIPSDMPGAGSNQEQKS